MSKLSKNNCSVTIFGDSIPKGVVNVNGKIENLKESVVNLVAKDLNIDIDNISMYGQTLTRLVCKGYLTSFVKAIDKSKKNIAIISLGGNDSDYDWVEVAKTPNVEHEPRTPLHIFEYMLNETIKLLNNNNVKVILTTIPPIDSKRYFDNVICKLADGDKVMEFLKGDVQNIYRHQESYNNIICKVATKNNCKLLDIREGFLQDRDFLSNLCQDGVHPNKKGHTVMANQILKQIKA